MIIKVKLDMDSQILIQKDEPNNHRKKVEKIIK